MKRIATFDTNQITMHSAVRENSQGAAMTVLLQHRGLLEAPVYAALHAFTHRPRERDVLRALHDDGVRDAALNVAYQIRTIAREEDERRVREKRAPVNYRKFYVSCVCIGLTYGGGRYDWWVFGASNTKHAKNAQKFCAEMRCLRAAREANCSCIGGFVVVGERQPDGRSGVLRQTLDPCGECRDCMRNPLNAVRLRHNTVVVTKQPMSEYAYVEPLAKLMVKHKESWP